MFSSIPPSVLFWLKIISFCITSLLALLGLLFDFKDKTTGRLTNWGRINLCGLIVSFVVGIASQKIDDDQTSAHAAAAAKQLKTIIDGNQSLISDDKASLAKLASVIQKNDTLIGAAQESLKDQEQLMASQSKLDIQVLRAYYPLEPLFLSYKKEYPMEQPMLAGYTERVRKDIVVMLRGDREGRGHTSDDLRDEDVDFVLSNPGSNLRPGTAKGEELAASLLLADDVRFTFAAHGEGEKITFTSVDPGTADIIVKLPGKGELKQKIQLAADFKRMVFIKEVQCDNPMRNGDRLAVSAVDLVDRKMSWDPFLMRGDGRKPEWNLTSFAIRFQNENDGGFFQNVVLIEPNRMSLEVTPQLLGLRGVLGSFKTAKR
jgi:hypothetical protein